MKKNYQICVISLILSVPYTRSSLGCSQWVPRPRRQSLLMFLPVDVLFSYTAALWFCWDLNFLASKDNFNLSYFAFIFVIITRNFFDTAILYKLLLNNGIHEIGLSFLLTLPTFEFVCMIKVFLSKSSCVCFFLIKVRRKWGRVYFCQLKKILNTVLFWNSISLYSLVI